MCGICGYKGDLTPAHLEAMCNAMAHRGPDDHGIYNAETFGVGLGHRRLSILDLSAAGHQPMSNEDGTVWITFNGEIYNFRELREELRANGHVFRSNCDTEVIIHLYEEFGVSCLEKLNGMFALGIWDERSGRLLLARDRAGIKPLYYINRSGCFVFASEIKAFLSAGLLDDRIDMHALQEYLALKYVSGNRTMLSGVRRLEPGHWIVVTDKGVQEGTFWRYRRLRETERKSADDYAEELRSIVRSCVSDQMVADVPVGAFLSGGLDSSIVVTEMARLSGDAVKCFTVDYEDAPESFNESDYAALTANHAGTHHGHARCANEHGVALLPSLVYAMDEPVSEPLMVSSFLLAETARAQVTVALAGEGADELFAGYRRYKLGRYAHMLRFLPFRARLWAQALATRLRGVYSFPYQVLRLSTTPQFLAKTNFAFWPEEITDLLAGDHTTYAPPLFLDDPTPEAVLEFLMEIDFRFRLPEYILTRADKMTMAHSLEMRVPLLDNRIIDFAMKLPWDLKLSGATDKYLLRYAFRDRLPKRIVSRSKMPFQAPFQKWLPRLVPRYLADSELVREGIVRDAALAQLLHDGAIPARDEKVFTLLVLELWFRLFVTKSLAPDDRA
ncbi:MAG: asparagine synthase (glutamine-hydrolyzing) [Desulfomonilaceae bacterium]